MAVTKITVSTAMRARDVSRPHAEHFADAAEREEAVTRPPEPEAPPAQSPSARSLSARSPSERAPSEPAPATRPADLTAPEEAAPRRRRRRGR